RHDARLVADPRGDPGPALLPDGGDGDVGLQGLADLRPHDGGGRRHRPDTRADRAVRTGPVRAGPDGAGRGERRHALARPVAGTALQVRIGRRLRLAGPRVPTATRRAATATRPR